jgi:putative transposase
MLRTGLYNLPLNPGKADKVFAVLRAYRSTAAALAAGQWKLLFTTGATNKNAKLGIPSRLSARYVQTCQYQVVGALDSYLANCANRFKELVRSSTLDEPTRVALLFINKYESWYKPEVRMRGQVLAPELLRMARTLMRHVRKTHRAPNLRRCNLALDEKVAVVEDAREPGAFSRWIKLSTLDKGKPVLLPVTANPWFDGVEGRQMPFVQINCNENGRLKAGIIKDVKETPYQTRTRVLGLDVGLKTLIASSKGDLLGQNVLDKLSRWDSAITTLAANRQKAGMRVRSARYDRLVNRMRSFLKNEIHRTLRQVLLRHKPALVSVEVLDFRSTQLSRRMNRLVQNFGRTEFNKALAGYAEQYKFEIADVEPAYSSQECARCHYVDARNRKGTKFVCRCCGHTTHADVNAARNHARRAGEAAGRSGGEAVGRRSRVKVLQELVERFATAKRMADLQRQVAADPGLLEPKRRHSSPGLVSMLSNPYFRAVVAPLRAQASSS